MIIVQKFGGTSVADTEKINRVVNIIKTRLIHVNQIIVVVSAMSGITNHLISLCNKQSAIDNISKLAEYDSALSAGETISSALLALALINAGINARSLAGQQILNTNSNHGNALVKSVNTDFLLNNLKNYQVLVVSGFQGLSCNYRVTTLGRGGSDTTATIIAAAINASRCDIYTDVDGIFSADPRIVHDAIHLKYISYNHMLDLADAGAKVLHSRSVEIAMRYNIPLRVLSSFSNHSGTLILPQEQIMEHHHLISVTANKNLVAIQITTKNYQLSQLNKIFVDKNIVVELLYQKNKNEFFVVTALNDKLRLELILKDLKEKKEIENYEINTQIAQITLVGYGLKNDLDFLKIILTEIEQTNAEIYYTQIRDTGITIFTIEDGVEKVIKTLHSHITKN